MTLGTLVDVDFLPIDQARLGRVYKTERERSARGTYAFIRIEGKRYLTPFQSKSDCSIRLDSL
jgi:hypothetical protein